VGESLTPTVLGGAVLLGSATLSIWLRQRPRPATPTEPVPAIESPHDDSRPPAAAGRSKGAAGCVGFGFVLLVLLASPLFLDRLPGQP
jgi:hypothetical protein